MRLVSHPNVVDLKAFFYSNGDKVGLYTIVSPQQFTLTLEGRGLSQPCARICT